MRVGATFQAVLLGAIALSVPRDTNSNAPERGFPVTSTSVVTDNSAPSLHYCLAQASPYSELIKLEEDKEQIKLLREKDKVRHELVESMVNVLFNLEQEISSGDINLPNGDVNNDIFQLLNYMSSSNLSDLEKAKIDSRINCYKKSCSRVGDKLALYSFQTLLPVYRSSYFSMGEPLRRTGMMEYLKEVSSGKKLTPVQTVRLIGAALYSNNGVSCKDSVDGNLKILAALHPHEYSDLRDKISGPRPEKVFLLARN